MSGRYFEVLGLRPALGRLIVPDDDRAIGEARVVVLGHEYWRNELGGDPGVVGDTLTVNGQPLTIVGVAPVGFTGLSVTATNSGVPGRTFCIQSGTPSRGAGEEE